METILAYNIAEQLKLNAYKEIQDNLESAKQVIIDKKLAFGEQSCVPFYYQGKDNPEDTMLLIGYGGLDGKTYFFSNILDNDTDVSEANVYIDDASMNMSVREAFEYVTNKYNEMGNKIQKALENSPYAIDLEV